MKYISAKEAAKRWGISDRRVRILCNAGKLSGVLKQGKSYQIPASCEKPSDGRKRSVKAGILENDNFHKRTNRYLKWDSDVVGVISKNNSISFTAPNYNEVVSLYTHGETKWSSEQFIEFLSERLVSRDRRDIERILFRLGLSNYDVLRISEITRGIHPKDLLWVANTADEALDDIVTDVFKSVFNQRIDVVGDSIDTPEGYNIKRYGVFDNHYGIFKQRINPLVTDVESEIAVYLLGKKLGVECCPCFRTDKDTIFSCFMYDFSKEYIVHFRRLFDGPRSDNEYQNLIAIRPQFREEIAKMILLDFITRQDDRHLSNMAIKISDKKESFYPLYDNGRSLFYEDTEEMVLKAISDPAHYATSFGYAGTYWDYIQEISKEHGGIKNLINCDICREEIFNILKSAGFTSYRLTGALEWITKTIGMIQGL